MAATAFTPVVRYIHRITAVHASQLTDSDLLDRFALHHDEDAFALLVHRHGRLVLGVCRRIVRDRHAAEDCFQAVFLVLATKAQTLKRSDSLGPWLHAVAQRVAHKARNQAFTRSQREQHTAKADAIESDQDLLWRDLRPALDDAIAALQQKYRTPFILCYLQGRTITDIAHELGRPKGTVAAWLARAREQLRGRLARRGIVLSGAGMTLAIAENAASAAVPAALASSTIKSAGLVAAGRAAVAASVTSHTVALMEGAIRSMMLTKLRIAAGAMAIAVGTVFLGYHATAAENPQEQAATKIKVAPAANPVAVTVRPPEMTQTQYDLRFEICELHENGVAKVVALPRMLLLEKQTGTIEIGKNWAEAANESAPQVRCSTTLDSRPDGKIQFALFMERFQSSVDEKDDTLITTGTSYRMQKLIKPGANVEFEMESAGAGQPRTRVRIATDQTKVSTVHLKLGPLPPKAAKSTFERPDQ
jgi:RNA polymerase sigma factor (sigma-70 family)